MAKTKPDKESAKQVDKVASDHAKVKQKIEEMVKQSSDIEKALKQVKSGQMEMQELQQMYDQQKKAVELMSSMMKKHHDSAMKTINNMKG